MIAKLEGPAVSQYCASRLLQATLDESLYELAGELVILNIYLFLLIGYASLVSLRS